MAHLSDYLIALRQGKTVEYKYFQNLSGPFDNYYTRTNFCKFTYLPDTQEVSFYESEEVVQDTFIDFGEKTTIITWEQLKFRLMQYNFSYLKILE